MGKKISVILCICFLTGLVSGCGSEENNLTEDNNVAAVEESNEPETADAAIGDVEGVVILTYTDRPIVIFGEPIYGVNVETSEIIIHGHWTGAGGTGVFWNEWEAYKLQGGTAERSFYIDSYAEFEEYTGDTPYIVDYPERQGSEWLY